MEVSIGWLIGSVIAVMSLVGGIIARDRYVMRSIVDGDARLHDRIDALSIMLSENFVRRDDLATHLESLEKAFGTMRDEQRATNSRIDNLLGILANRDR